MEMNWKYFIGAAIVVGGALLRAGAPAVPVATGIVLAVLLSLFRLRKNSGRA
jgi:hypothetical protein